MKQRLQFGQAESLGRVALRGGLGGSATFIVPQFGRRCVCCNADAMGRTQDYDPSTDRIQAPSIPMPVCGLCARHALQTPTVPILQACLFMVGVATTGLGVMYLDERPQDQFLWGMIAVGATMTVAAILWIWLYGRRRRRAARDGHHPGLEFSVGHGRTILDTENHELVEELLALNPSARRMPTPWLWRRKQRKDLPVARVVPPSPPPDEPRALK